MLKGDEYLRVFFSIYLGKGLASLSGKRDGCLAMTSSPNFWVANAQKQLSRTWLGIFHAVDRYWQSHLARLTEFLCCNPFMTRRAGSVRIFPKRIPKMAANSPFINMLWCSQLLSGIQSLPSGILKCSGCLLSDEIQLLLLPQSFLSNPPNYQSFLFPALPPHPLSSMSFLPWNPKLVGWVNAVGAHLLLQPFYTPEKAHSVTTWWWFWVTLPGTSQGGGILWAG